MQESHVITFITKLTRWFNASCNGRTLEMWLRFDLEKQDRDRLLGVCHFCGQAAERLCDLT